MPRLVAGNSRLELRRDGGGLRLRLREADARFQPRDHLIVRVPGLAVSPADRSPAASRAPRGSGTRSVSGMTPITVRKAPFARIAVPTMSGALARTDRARGAGREGSPVRRRADRRPSRKPRPRIGCTPSASNAADGELAAAEPLGPSFLGREVDRRERVRADVLERRSDVPATPRGPGR